MKCKFFQLAVFLLTVFAIHLSSGYDASKPVRYPDADPYYPPNVPFANNPKTTPAVAVATSTTQTNLAEPVSIACILFTRGFDQLIHVHFV